MHRSRPAVTAVTAGLLAALAAGCSGSAAPAGSAAGSAAGSPTGSATGSPTGSATGSPSAAATASGKSPARGGDNGVARLAADRILARSQAAAKAATSVHVKGELAEQGQRIGIDIHMKRTEGGTGTITNNGRTVEVLRIGSSVYVKGDQAFWTSVGAGPSAAMLGGKYVKAPSNDRTVAAFTSFTDMTAFFDAVLQPAGTIAKGAVKQVAGTPAIALTDAADKGTLYVATQGQPYPLRLEPGAADKGEGQLEFSDYNEPVRLAVPPADQVLDLSTLRGGG